jgi:hypothetical protein
MSNNKQTAVEWLVEQLFADNEIFGCSKELLEQAKEMEKQQIERAYQWDRFPCSDEEAEQYYNEEYGK